MTKAIPPGPFVVFSTAVIIINVVVTVFGRELHSTKEIKKNKPQGRHEAWNKGSNKEMESGMKEVDGNQISQVWNQGLKTGELKSIYRSNGLDQEYEGAIRAQIG